MTYLFVVFSDVILFPCRGNVQATSDAISPKPEDNVICAALTSVYYVIFD